MICFPMNDLDAHRLVAYDRALTQFARWMTEHRPLSPSFHPDCVPYAAMPLYAQAVGDADLLARTMLFVEDRCRQNADAFLHPPSRTLVPYRAAWFLLGAVLSQHFTLARWLESWILPYLHRPTGGVFGTTEARHAGHGEICFDSTTHVCAVLCVAGNIAEAARIGDFLRRLVAAQPEPNRRFFCTWHTDGRLMTEFDSKQARNHAIAWESPQQYLYKVGLLVRAFALLYARTNEAAYLDLAESLHRNAIDRSPDVWRNTVSHKLGWSAHTLWLITRKREYVSDACNMADRLVDLQQPDGGYDYPEFLPPYDQVPDVLKCNYGEQFTTWIAYARSLLLCDGDRR
jgi:hypothetical protein